MKAVIFVFYLFIAFVPIFNATGLSDDVTERMAQFLSMSKTDIQICINKTYVKVEDLMRLDQLVDDDIETIDINKSVLKVGCLFACLLQKKKVISDAYINEVKLKEFLNSNMPHAEYRFISERNRILDTCIDRVKSKSEECEVTLKFILCLTAETKRLMGERQ
ncbi:pheromone-binding protein Gp-9-like [Polyergus mexicanus]|uniref:pheromone-binding protein Gp-9-like n=1 Tax=Polyergus mexicanus TaxID=615972 RepID=UPI0038B5BEE6